MATATLIGQALGGALMKQGASWAACQAATPSVNTAATSGFVDRSGPGTFYLSRLAYSFDLSPYAGATISAATLRLYQADDYRDEIDGRICLPYYHDFGPSLEAADWVVKTSMVAAATPMDPGSTTGYRSFVLIDPDLHLLSHDGKFILCMNDETTEPSGDNYTVWILGASGSNKPQLEITYEMGPPSGLPIPIAQHHYTQQRKGG